MCIMSFKIINEEDGAVANRENSHQCAVFFLINVIKMLIEKQQFDYNIDENHMLTKYLNDLYYVLVITTNCQSQDSQQIN